MNFVFSINQGFLPHFSVTLISLLETHPQDQLTCYILHDGIVESSQEELLTLVNGKSVTLNFVKLDPQKFSELPVNFHLSRVCYYRLMIPNLIPEEKVIYLDSDIIIRKSLRPLWEMDLSGNLLGAVQEFSTNWNPDLEVDSNYGYFNTGIMLMNLLAWREEGFHTKVFQFIEENPKLIRFTDQCGINHCGKGRIVRLSPRFNFQAMYYEEGFILPKSTSKKELEEAQKEVAIIHFTGSKKPWHWGCKHPDRKLYWKFLAKTPYKRRFPENFSLVNLMREIAPKSILESSYGLKNKVKRKFRNTL